MVEVQLIQSNLGERKRFWEIVGEVVSYGKSGRSLEKSQQGFDNLWFVAVSFCRYLTPQLVGAEDNHSIGPPAGLKATCEKKEGEGKHSFARMYLTIHEALLAFPPETLWCVYSMFSRDDWLHNFPHLALQTVCVCVCLCVCLCVRVCQHAHTKVVVSYVDNKQTVNQAQQIAVTSLTDKRPRWRSEWLVWNVRLLSPKAQKGFRKVQREINYSKHKWEYELWFSRGQRSQTEGWCLKLQVKVFIRGYVSLNFICHRCQSQILLRF